MTYPGRSCPDDFVLGGSLGRVLASGRGTTVSGFTSGVLGGFGGFTGPGSPSKLRKIYKGM